MINCFHVVLIITRKETRKQGYPKGNKVGNRQSLANMNYLSFSQVNDCFPTKRKPEEAN